MDGYNQKTDGYNQKTDGLVTIFLFLLRLKGDFASLLLERSARRTLPEPRR